MLYYFVTAVFVIVKFSLCTYLILVVLISRSANEYNGKDALIVITFNPGLKFKEARKGF